ncbi:MAG: hypothetical protein AAGA30_03680 [Planctomycetota bacterium]
MPNLVQENQSTIVQELLERQDQALEELDQLNQKLEATIKSIVAEREMIHPLEVSEEFTSETGVAEAA